MEVINTEPSFTKTNLSSSLPPWHGKCHASMIEPCGIVYFFFDFKSNTFIPSLTLEKPSNFGPRLLTQSPSGRSLARMTSPCDGLYQNNMPDVLLLVASLIALPCPAINPSGTSSGKTKIVSFVSGLLYHRLPLAFCPICATTLVLYRSYDLDLKRKLPIIFKAIAIFSCLVASHKSMWAMK